MKVGEYLIASSYILCANLYAQRHRENGHWPRKLDRQKYWFIIHTYTYVDYLRSFHVRAIFKSSAHCTDGANVMCGMID